MRNGKEKGGKEKEKRTMRCRVHSICSDHYGERDSKDLEKQKEGGGGGEEGIKERKKDERR